MITFRLADSLPAPMLADIRGQLGILQKKGGLTGVDRTKWLRQRLEDTLDKGYGSCLLREERFAALVETALLFFDGQRYCLSAWVVMPNHVHVMIGTLDGFPLGRILHSWKSYTAHEINKAMGKNGRVWQPEYFDRVIRDEGHYADALDYIHNNPVKAGLVKDAREWRYSSARRYLGETG
jgi:putative transposase